MRRGREVRALALLAALVALLLVGGSGGSAEAAAKLGGCELFPSFSGGAGERSAASLRAWNQRVTRSPRHPRSGRYIRAIRNLGGNQALHPDFGSNPDYGIPFALVPRGQPFVPVRIGPDGYPEESDFGPAPIPPGAPIEAGSDHHVLVLQRGACRLWELYRAEYLGGVERAWQAASTAHWRLGSARLRPNGWTSADAAGLPILPGLVRYREVAAGRVRHALRVTFAATRRAYLHPATHHASSRCERFLPPMGLRLRLRKGYFRRHLADFPRGSQARPIFRALRHYGMLVADNGSNWFFTGATDPRWDDEDLGRLKRVPARAFEVVGSKARQRSPC